MISKMTSERSEYWKRKMMWEVAKSNYHTKIYHKSIEKQWKKIEKAIEKRWEEIKNDETRT